MNSERPLPVFLTPGQVGDLLRISEKTLDNWRAAGFGPPYRRIGKGPQQKAIYELSALGEWLKHFAHRGDDTSV